MDDSRGGEMLMPKKLVPEIVKAPLRKFHRMVPKLRYNFLYRWRYDPHGEFERPHIFDPSITDQQIVEGFGYTRAIMRWMRDQGDATLRVNYPLRPDSIVFDVGGFSGSWCAEIVRRYDAYVHVFEPITEFAALIAEKFAENRKVHVHRFGLSDRDERLVMGVGGQGSSVFYAGGPRQEVVMRDISSFVSEKGITRIDLIKINIEGGEYSLLPRMIETGVIEMCEHLQVQFHEWVRPLGGSHRARRLLQERLRVSHELSYDYPFVWEGWKRIPDRRRISSS
jgi:FkbM family methyltransferase